MIWLSRLALIAAGIGIMWVEGQHQPSPGVGFAVALAFLLGAAMIERREKQDE